MYSIGYDLSRLPQASTIDDFNNTFDTYATVSIVVRSFVGLCEKKNRIPFLFQLCVISSMTITALSLGAWKWSEYVSPQKYEGEDKNRCCILNHFFFCCQENSSIFVEDFQVPNDA